MHLAKIAEMKSIFKPQLPIKISTLYHNLSLDDTEESLILGVEDSDLAAYFYRK
jgi:hypothetical protein